MTEDNRKAIREGLGLYTKQTVKRPGVPRTLKILWAITAVLFVLAYAQVFAAESKGQAAQLVGVTSMPMGKTNDKGQYRAIAREGECFAVKNGRLFYTTKALAEKYGLKAFDNSADARREIAKSGQKAKTGLSGARL